MSIASTSVKNNMPSSPSPALVKAENATDSVHSLPTPGDETLASEKQSVLDSESESRKCVPEAPVSVSPQQAWPLGQSKMPSSSSCFQDLDHTQARVIYEQRDALATLFRGFSTNTDMPESVSGKDNMRRSLVMATTPRKSVGSTVARAPYIAEQPFIDMARHCNLSPTLLSHSELFEVYKLAYSTDEDCSMGLTFPGFCYALCHCALVVFSGIEWDDVYQTGGAKLRLFLFWIEQGLTNGKSHRGTSAPVKFPGNAGKLMAVLDSPQSNILSHYKSLNASEAEFVRAGISFSVIDFEIGGVHLKTPFLLPHVAKLDEALQRLFHWFVCPGAAGGVPRTNPAMMSSSTFARFVRACKLQGPGLTSGLIDIIFKVVTTGDTGATFKNGTQTNLARASIRSAKAGGMIKSGRQHDLTHKGVWKENSFTQRRQPVSMVNRKMTYETFYVALTDLAIRKYVKKNHSFRKTAGNRQGKSKGGRSSSAMLAAWAPGMSTFRVSGEAVRTALHTLIVQDILPLLARFWHKVGLNKTDCTAVVAGSPQKKRELRTFGDSVGRTPEKRAAGWKQRWLVVSDLESLMASATVLHAFHIDTSMDVRVMLESTNTSATATHKSSVVTLPDDKEHEDPDTCLAPALLYVSQDAAAKAQKLKQEEEQKRKADAARRQQRKPYYSTGTRRRTNNKRASKQLVVDTANSEDAQSVINSGKDDIKPVVKSSPVSPERAIEIMHELSSLHSLLAKVGETTDGMELGIDESSLQGTFKDSQIEGKKEESIGTNLIRTSLQRNIEPSSKSPTSTSASSPEDIQVHESSPGRELRLATQANEAKDRELATILGSVREKLMKLKLSIGQDVSRHITPPAPSVPTKLVAPPKSKDAENHKSSKKTKKKIGRESSKTPAATKSSLLRERLSHGKMQAPESSYVFPSSERKHHHSDRKRDSAMKVQDLSSPAETKASILRRMHSQTLLLSGTQSMLSDRNKTLEGIDILPSSSSGSQPDEPDSNKVDRKMYHHKERNNKIVPPPHIQRRMRRISQGLPEKRAKSRTYMSTPLCGYSSFGSRGSKFGNGEVTSISPLHQNRNRNTSIQNKIAKRTNTMIKKRPREVLVGSNSIHSKAIIRKSSTKNGLKTSVSEGAFEIVFDQGLNMRVVNLEYAMPTDENEATPSESNLIIVGERDVVVHCRLLLSHEKKSGKLKTVRVLLTRPHDDAFFHFRHFCDQQLYDSLNGKLKLDRSYAEFPELLSKIFTDSKDVSRQIGLVLAIHSDGRARLQALKTEVGSKTSEMLSLNFLRSPEVIVRQYANSLLSQSSESSNNQ